MPVTSLPELETCPGLPETCGHGIPDLAYFNYLLEPSGDHRNPGSVGPGPVARRAFPGEGREGGGGFPTSLHPLQ